MEKFITYSKKFTELAEAKGYSNIYIEKCLNYANPLFRNNVPVIYSVNHLSQLVGYNPSYLTRSIISTSFFYREFKIKKKNGKLRKISEPLPSLKEIQYFILHNILYNLKDSKFCKSYLPKKNFIVYLKFHVDEKEILTLDLEDFFPSLKYELVYNFFSELGYSKDVSMYLSCITTYVDKQKLFEKEKRYLPQGSPTSPYLSNLLLRKFDDELGKYCYEKKIKYTRYADDLAFSGEKIDKDDLIKFVKQKIDLYNLKLNKDKINYMKQNTQQIISGVIVNKKLQLPKSKRSEIRKNMYYINNFGLQSHLERINEKRDNYVLHMLGLIQYGLTLNPNDNELIKYKEQLTLLYKNK